MGVYSLNKITTFDECTSCMEIMIESARHDMMLFESIIKDDIIQAFTEADDDNKKDSSKKSIGDRIKGIWEAIKKFFETIWKKITGFFTGKKTSTEKDNKDYIDSVIKPNYSKLKSFDKEAKITIYTYLKDSLDFDAIMNAITTDAAEIKDKMKASKDDEAKTDADIDKMFYEAISKTKNLGSVTDEASFAETIKKLKEDGKKENYEISKGDIETAINIIMNIKFDYDAVVNNIKTPLDKMLKQLEFDKNGISDENELAALNKTYNNYQRYINRLVGFLNKIISVRKEDLSRAKAIIDAAVAALNKKEEKNESFFFDDEYDNLLEQAAYDSRLDLESFM